MRRLLVRLVVVLLVVVVPASVSWTSGITWHVREAGGAPAAGAFVRYHYQGHLLNPVHSVSYDSGPSVIVRADPAGRVIIPWQLHVRRPLPVSLPPRLMVDDVYVPRLRNAFGPVAESTSSRPGVFLVDHAAATITVFDVSQDPARWEVSLRSLYQCIRETIEPTRSRGRSESDATTLAQARALIAHFRTDFAAFLGRYADHPRQRPAPPAWATEDERRQWESNADAHLAREPTWGPYVERTFRGRLLVLDRFERSLP
jgi:hypothetical protein